MNQEEDRKARALADACIDHTRGTMVGMAYEAVYALAADVVRLGLIAEDHDCLAFPWDDHAPSRVAHQRQENARLRTALEAANALLGEAADEAKRLQDRIDQLEAERPAVQP